jgi:hypothetical protein
MVVSTFVQETGKDKHFERPLFSTLKLKTSSEYTFWSLHDQLVNFIVSCEGGE